MPKTRVEAFSDGVMAVAITLLALDLPIPDPASTPHLAHTLAKQWPSFAAFAVSFMTIGVVWINHHAMLRRIGRVDYATLMLNLLLLLFICLVPFSTALLARYLTESHGAQFAAAIYGASLLLMSCGFYAIQRHVLSTRTELLRGGMSPELRAQVLRRNRAGLFPYAIATAAAALSAYLSYGICLAVAVYYAIPRTTSDVMDDDLAEQHDPPG